MEFQSRELLRRIKHSYNLISNAGNTEANSSEEPDAVIPHVGICAGGGG